MKTKYLIKTKIKSILKLNVQLLVILILSIQTIYATQTIDTLLDVGAIDGTHSVNLSGAFTYTIPIEIPEGTMGMQPNLSLNYSSQSGNGIAGYGWNLSGMSAISRVNKSIYYDEAVSAPNLTNNDALSLDGNRLLFHKNVVEGGKVVKAFYTEMESFQQITTANNTQLKSFIVKTKDGKTIEYGNTADSKLMTENNVTALVWYINKVTDRNGNYMTYHYKNYGRQVVLNRIEYTGNGTLVPYTKIYFFYKDRFDKSYSYTFGSEIETNRLLSEIKILTNHFEHYKSYQLIYSSDDPSNTENQFNYLTGFQEWGSEITLNGKGRLNSLTFEYGTSNNEINVMLQTDPLIKDLYNINNGDAVFIPGNYNGDGLTDFLVLTYDVKNNENKARYKEAFIYVNNNKNSSPATSGFLIHNITNKVVSNNQGSHKIIELFQRDDNEWLVFNPKYNLPISDVRIMNGDMNGDGIDDIVIGREIIQKNYLYYDALLSNDVASYKLGDRNIKVDDEEGFGILYDKVEQHASTLLDADGDGRLEFFAFNNYSGLYTLYSFDGRVNLIDYCHKYVGGECLTYNIAKYTNSLKVHDFDGDGKNEVTYSYRYLQDFSYDFHFDLEKNEIKTSGLNILNQDFYEFLDGRDGSNEEKKSDMFVDFNGDGKIDKLELGETGIEAYISKGNGEYEIIGPNIPYVYNNPINDGDDIDPKDSDNFQYYFIDINSDRFTDCVVMNPRNYSIDIYLNKGLGIEFTPYSFKFADYPNSAWWDGSHYLCQFVDIDGDGVLEIQAKTSSEREGYRTTFISVDVKPTQSRLLENVYDSYGNKTNVVYASLATGENYSTTQKQDYPFRTVAPPMQVVNYVSTPAGSDLGDNIVTTYRYTNLTAHLKGKGSMGFAKVNSYNARLKLTDESTYKLDKTNVLMVPDKTLNWITFDNITNTKVSESNSTYKVVNLTNPNRKWLRLDESIAFDYTNQTKTTSKYMLYDTFGNIKNSETKVYDILNNANTLKQTTTEVASYKNCNWWASYLPTLITTTLDRAGVQGKNSRTVTYDYDVSNGNLIVEKTDPNTFNEVSRGYKNYNQFGNPVLTNVLAFGETLRKTTVHYDETGRFITKQYNSNNNLVEQATFNQVWGMPATVTDVYGNVISTTYDKYGRVKTITDYLSNVSTINYNWNVSNNAANTGYNIKTIHKITRSKPSSPQTIAYFDSFDREVLKSAQKFGGGKIYSFNKYDYKKLLVDESGSFEIGTGKEKPIITNYVYDDLNRIKSSIVSQNGSNLTNRISYIYTTRGVEVAGDGIVTKKSTFDVMGKVITAQDPGGYLHYTYNNFNELYQVKDGEGNVLTENIYDNFGRQIESIDINAGKTIYKYNPFDELTEQVDANGSKTEIVYDNLGRTNSKTITSSSETISNFNYTYNSISENGALKLKSESGPSNYSNIYVYDEYGRLKNKTDKLGATSYTTSNEYNQYGNVEKITYPNNFWVNYEYDTNTGKLHKAKIGDNTVYELKGTNHLGQVTDYNYQTGTIPIKKSFNSLGMPKTTKAKNGTLFNWEYDFNTTNGNLNYRKDVKRNSTENFKYDQLHRITHVNNAEVAKYSYNGNIDYKSDAGDYNYNQPDGKINAVSGISNNSNAIPSFGQVVNYRAYDRPWRVYKDQNNYHQMYYGPKLQRKFTETYVDGKRDTRTYLGNYEIFKKPGEAVGTSILYLSFTNNLDAIYVKEQGANVGTIYYVFTDYLGSILKIVDKNGNTMEEQSFDLWGRKRNPQNWNQIYNETEDALPKTLTWLNRGYTGHEHLYDFGIINMNNRLYDPVLGRMLAVDNEVPDAQSTQGYNRYAYAMNNPFKYTDPSGDVIVPILLGAAIAVTSNGIGNAVNGDPFFFNGGNAAFMGGVGGAFSFGIGEAFAGASNFGLQTLAHGHLGGLMTAAQGGKFKHGFLSGVAGSLAGGAAGKIKSKPMRFGVSTLGAGVVGGGASSLAGGNFWDGFRNGVISSTLNHSFHNGAKKLQERIETYNFGKSSAKVGLRGFTGKAYAVILTEEVKNVDGKWVVSYNLLTNKTNVHQRLTVKIVVNGKEYNFSPYENPNGEMIPMGYANRGRTQDIPLYSNANNIADFVGTQYTRTATGGVYQNIIEPLNLY